MQARLGDLRGALVEALKKRDADRVAATLRSAAEGAGTSVTTSVDDSGSMLNVFVRVVSGDPDAVEATLGPIAAQEGWTLLSRSDKRGTVLWYEPSAAIKGPVLRAKLPAVLYHVTPAANVEAVLRTGLHPRERQHAGSTRRYSPRVYLASDIGGAQATVNRPGDWRVLRVDVGQVPKDVEFYVDQEFGFRRDGTPVAVYVTGVIPSQAISA